MNQPGYIKIIDGINKTHAEIELLNKFDPLTNIIKERFQHEITNHLSSLSRRDQQTTKDQIIKSSTTYGTSIENAIEAQKEIYLDLGRKHACTLFMFDTINSTFSSADIRLFYEILFGESEYRENDALILNQKGETFKFPVSSEIPYQIDNLIDWLDSEKIQGKIHPIELAVVFHHRFVSIHPFYDGNGRIGRLLMNIILMSYGFLPVLITSEKRIKYYDALQNADSGDISSLFEFISDKEDQALNKFINSPEYLSVLAKHELQEQLKKIKGSEKCFVLTEDSRIDDLLKLIFESSGFNIKETTFISYKGCSNISSVTLFSVFVKEKLPHISIVVHLDKDYLTEREILRQKMEFDKLGVYFFITRGSDVESYFLNPEHINKCHPEISIEKALELVNQSIADVRDVSIAKFRIKEFGEKHKDKISHLDDALIQIFDSSLLRFTHGKTALKALKQSIQILIKSNSKLDVISEHISDDDLVQFAKNIWQIS